MSVVANTAMAGGLEVKRLRILYELVTALIRASELEDVYDAALSSLLEATSAERAAILLFDEDGVMRFKASRGLSEAYQAAVTGHAPWKPGQQGAKPILTPDVRLDESLADYSAVFERENIRALAFIPLMLETGVLGKFMLYYGQPHTASPEELEIAQVIAVHVILAVERKRSDLARSRTEHQLQSILDNSSTIIFVKDLQSRYRLINRRYEELFHVKRSEIVGRTDFDLFPAEIAAPFVENDRLVLASGKPLAIEEHAPQDDGLHSFISVKFPLNDASGRITGLCGISTDVTERKRLERGNRQLAAIVESSDDAIISKNLDGVITSWNNSAQRLFGYTSDEAIGRTVAELIIPDDRQDEESDILARLGRGERVDHFETKRRRKDGTLLDISLTISPVKDENGVVIGASKIARDITERKLAEAEHAVLLSREQEALHTAELLNRIAPRLAAELDPEKLVQEVTDVATSAIGAEFGSFFHNVVNEKGESYMLYTLSGVPKEAFAGFPMPRNTAVFDPTFRGEAVVRSENIMLDPRYGKTPPHYGMPKGHLPVRSYLAVPVKSRSGQVLGGLFFGHSAPGKFTQAHEDVVNGIAAQAAIAMDNARLFQQTQRAQAELKRSNDDLRRANRDLEVFAYSASHDLQEPLRTIAISAELIEQSWGSRLTGEDAEFLSNILAGARRMSCLIDDLAAYMRARKSEEAPPSIVDSARVLSGALANLKQVIEQAGASVTTDILPAVAIHEGRLAQLFQNLISNAIKYRRKEGPRVHITAQDRDGWCVFSVADNGIGIEPEFAEKIFAPFKRLHSNDEYPGSGIGLAICQRVVEQYGGRIWLHESTPGRGSTFCFTVPRG
jgi:PAS domain S-box-containing protein